MNIVEIKNYLSNCIDKDMYFTLGSYNKKIVLYNYLKDTEKEIETLNNKLEYQKLHNTHLENELLDIVKILEFENEGITFQDIKNKIQELKGE